MHVDRLLRALNIVIGIVIVAAVYAAYWFFWRPLPVTSGRLEAPVSQPVTVTRDGLGVPSLHAKTEEDVLFTQGYVTAGDRMWQMDGLRRFAAGELAEIIGPAGIEADRESRKLRMRHIAEQIYPALPARDRAQFAAYARGVNHYIETHRGRYSFEFAVLGYDPRPWSVVDSLLVGLYMYRNLTTSYPEKLARQNLLAGGDAAKVKYLYPVRAGTEVIPGGDVQPGSNAWAVSGAHTASGRPLLANDMHLEYSIPGIWYMTALEAPGLHVAGVALPGVPGIIVGHNEQIAWGVTNLHFDVQELYSERLDSSTGQYLFRGKVEQAQLEREWIRVKGRPPVEERHWITRHGPVIVDDARQHISLKWAAADPGNFQFPFLELNRAKNWNEFQAGLARFPGPGQNFVYADRAGNIGYHATGKLPRRTWASDVPVDGTSGDFEWNGYIPFEELPAAFNPASGYLVTANQNPFPVGGAYEVSGTFASPYRSNQIRAMLRATERLRPADMLRIQKDVYSGFTHHFAQLLVA
ncbi:MAG: penicillin acylase family protein, partial [Acidobacteriota bacterium]|nr:penicillin acylase family protein [Acidobacteriota bacterium]